VRRKLQVFDDLWISNPIKADHFAGKRAAERADCGGMVSP
jgi:hypothetical protein